jgi:hypothetical protein
MPSEADELREAFQQSGCAICQLADRAVVRFMRSVSYEQVNGPPLRARLRASRGFCTTHAHRWLREAQSVLGTALIYRDAITAALRELEEPPTREAGGLQGLLGRSPRPHRPPPCPACRVQHEAQDRYIDALVQNVDSPAVGAALARSEGVCLPHTLRARQRGGARAEAICARSREVAADLIQHLSEVVRKEDYRFRHEPRSDAERVAPRRAITWAAGQDGLVGP